MADINLRTNQNQFIKFCELYETTLRLLKNPTCKKCDAKIRNPLAIWHVGASFATSNIRVLFIGKPHRGKPGIIRPSGLIDPRKKVESLRDKAWPYWSYTREIARQIFGDREDGWNRIALTNLVKCTSVSHR